MLGDLCYRELSKHFSVVTYDLRGHGKSPVAHKNFTLRGAGSRPRKN